MVATGYDGAVRDVALIDLAHFVERGPVFYDSAYLELATLLSKMDAIGQERWYGLTMTLAQGDASVLPQLDQYERSWATDIFSGRRVVQDLIEGAHKDRMDDLFLQGLLCQISVGLAFIHKKPRQDSGSLGLSQDQYRQAFIWAAAHLDQYLRAGRIDWIPAAEYIVPIGLQALQAARHPAAQWRELVRFDPGGFNILVLSPLARAAHEVAVRELLRLPWNLVVDFGTGSLASDHSTVRQGTVRQAWPFGSPLDTSVLSRAALWYFANGRADIGDAPPAAGIREWRQRYLRPLQQLVGVIARKIAPPSVRSLVVGSDFPPDFFRLIMESLDSDLAAVSQPTLVASAALQPLPDVPMSCASLDDVLEAISALQDPATVDRADGILAPHRTESGVSLSAVNPEVMGRISMDLQVVHRGLANWSTPGRRFGADFRRGQVIEWSELDNKLDVERTLLTPLLAKVRAELAKSTNSTVNLLHEPSAGGTTLSRRISWTLMEQYPTVLLLQTSKNTSEYLAELSQECGLPLLVVMEAEVITESARELLFRELLDSNTRVVFLWVSRTYGDASSADVLKAELEDAEAESFRQAYAQDVSGERGAVLARLTADPELREQRSPFFYGLVAFEDGYLGVDRLVEEIVRPLNATGKEIIADLALVSLYFSEGFPAAEFDELCGVFHNGERPFPALSPFTVRVGQHIKIPHRLIAKKALRAVARVQEHWEADLSKFALTLLEHLRKIGARESERLKDMVTAVFVTRDTAALLSTDTDVAAGGLPGQRRFAPLIHDLSSAEIARKVLRRVFNDWPEDPHFAVHYARHLLYEDPRDIQQAIRVTEMSRRTELGTNDDTVVHTLGMCYRIRMESVLRAAREKEQSLTSVEDALQSDSGAALECFSLAASLDRISEYGHLSSIQTVSTLLRGAVELGGTDLAGLLKTPGRRWLASALEQAETSIKVLESRPGGRPTVRARRIIAEWALIYGQVDKVIQQLRTLSDAVQDPGVRRALCSAVLTKYRRKWNTVPDGELQTITNLMERNIEGNEFSDADLSRWLRASRLRRGFQIETAIERLVDWNKLRPDAVEPAYYLYVFYFLQWLRSGRTNRGYIEAVQKWLEVCRANRPVGAKGWSYEWLVERGGRFDAVHFMDLDFDPVQTVTGKSPEHTDRLKQLRRVEGTLSRYLGRQHALVDIGQRLTIHITPRTEIVKDHEGRRLKIFVSFSYDGPIGWDPELM